MFKRQREQGNLISREKLEKNQLFMGTGQLSDIGMRETRSHREREKDEA